MPALDMQPWASLLPSLNLISLMCHGKLIQNKIYYVTYPVQCLAHYVAQ